MPDKVGNRVTTIPIKVMAAANLDRHRTDRQLATWTEASREPVVALRTRKKGSF